MRKLLSANFSRLWRDKTFLLCMGAMLFYAVAYMLNGCRLARRDPSEFHYSLDEFYFHFAMTIGLFAAVFCSMFHGTEYSDGTIRNKLVVGHTRVGIYLSNLILTFSATLLMMLVWLIGALIAIPTLGVWKMGIPYLLLYLLIAVCFIAAFSAVFTCISMLSANKAVTVVISIFLFLGLLVFTGRLYTGLSEPETITDVIITADGMQLGDPAPNPNYISGTMREAYQLILDFLPTGQGLQMWMLGIAHPIRMLVSSLVITGVTTVGGICIFQRKNVK